VINATTYLVGGPPFGSTSPGVYRTTDGAMTWKMVSATAGAVPPLHASDGTIYWIGSDGSMSKSADQGQTWSSAGAPGTFAGPQGPLTNYGIMELPGGRIAAMGNQTILVSSDQGATWSPATSAYPMTSGEGLHGAVYSTQRKAFYVWHDTCGADNPVVADAIMRFDYQ
jgi:hypothetical protein